MEEKMLADWESEKKIMNSESTGKDRVYEEQSQPARDRLALEDPTEDGEETEPVDEEGEGDIGTGPNPEMDSDEEQTEEPVTEVRKLSLVTYVSMYINLDYILYIASLNFATSTSQHKQWRGISYEERRLRPQIKAYAWKEISFVRKLGEGTK